MSYITEENAEAFNAYMQMQDVDGHAAEDASQSDAEAFNRAYVGSAVLIDEDGHNIEHTGPTDEMCTEVGIMVEGLTGEEISWAWGELESSGQIETYAYAGEVYFFLHPWFAAELGR